MTAVYMRYLEPVDDQVTARQKLAPKAFFQGANFPFEGRSFAVGVKTYAYYYGYLPDFVSTLSVDLLWMQTGSAATGSVQWFCACAAISPGDTTRLSDKNFAPANLTSTAANGDQILQKTTVTLPGAAMDSIAAGDLMILRLYRDPAVVSCGGTAVLIAVSINYTGV